MEKLRVGIVGFGGICNGAHKSAWQASDQTQIVAICDINPKKLEKAKEEFGDDVKYYIEATDAAGNNAMDPYCGADDPHHFIVE